MHGKEVALDLKSSPTLFHTSMGSFRDPRNFHRQIIGDRETDLLSAAMAGDIGSSRPLTSSSHQSKGEGNVPCLAATSGGSLVAQGGRMVIEVRMKGVVEV